MASLFQMMNGQTPSPAGPEQPVQAGQQQPVDFNTAMGQLRSNPMGMLKQAGYEVPENVGNNPQAMVMHLIQSGQVSNPMMQMIQPMLNRMGVK